MMLDAEIVAVSPSSVWRVLSQGGLLLKWNGKPSKKGTGFEQPLAAQQHWHIDVSYINISGTMHGVWSRANVDHYNNVRLNSATGYITPKDMLAGRQQEIQAERDRKLEAARQQRQSRRQQAA